MILYYLIKLILTRYITYNNKFILFNNRDKYRYILLYYLLYLSNNI